MVSSETSTSVGGAKKEYKSTDTKVTFIKNNKEYTRVVYTNKRNTEYVKYENDWIPVSKLHKKGGSPPPQKRRKTVSWNPRLPAPVDLNKSPPKSAYSRPKSAPAILAPPVILTPPITLSSALKEYGKRKYIEDAKAAEYAVRTLMALSKNRSNSKNSSSGPNGSSNSRGYYDPETGKVDKKPKRSSSSRK